MTSKGQVKALMQIIVFGFFGILATEAVVNLSDMNPLGEIGSIELLFTGLIVFGIFLGIAQLGE